MGVEKRTVTITTPDYLPDIRAEEVCRKFEIQRSSPEGRLIRKYCEKNVNCQDLGLVSIVLGGLYIIGFGADLVNSILPITDKAPWVIVFGWALLWLVLGAMITIAPPFLMFCLLDGSIQKGIKADLGHLPNIEEIIKEIQK